MRSIYATIAFFASTITALPAGQTQPALYCPPRPATAEEQRAIFEQAVQTIIVDQQYAEGVPRHYDEGYIQHDPFLLSGRQNVLDYLANFDPDSVNFTVINKGIDNNLSHLDGWIYGG
ncbi:hypothetical protein COL922a_011716 [Colletotrichum nupharicola]|nr:hypothetical protein COL922a_011716 [Colletotrichum nupharicola]